MKDYKVYRTKNKFNLAEKYTVAISWTLVSLKLLLYVTSHRYSTWFIQHGFLHSKTDTLPNMNLSHVHSICYSALLIEDAPWMFLEETVTSLLSGTMSYISLFWGRLINFLWWSFPPRGLLCPSEPQRVFKCPQILTPYTCSTAMQGLRNYGSFLLFVPVVQSSDMRKVMRNGPILSSFPIGIFDTWFSPIEKIL